MSAPRQPVSGLRLDCRCWYPRAGREKRLPRRLRCSGLAALRAAAGLPSDSAVVLWSGAEGAAEVVMQLAGSRRSPLFALTSASVLAASITGCTYDHIRAEKTSNNS